MLYSLCSIRATESVVQTNFVGIESIVDGNRESSSIFSSSIVFFRVVSDDSEYSLWFRWSNRLELRKVELALKHATDSNEVFFMQSLLTLAQPLWPLRSKSSEVRNPNPFSANV